ncbi:MAG: anion permease [gamma proteobacterium symbiont of Taylorina sp.]|nr:anion permease [gamma proteobacterium symbiont of Taylorina sp.]
MRLFDKTITNEYSISIKTLIYTMVFLSITISIILLLFFHPSFLTADESKTSALLLLIIALWATSIIPEHITALLFFFSMIIFSLAPVDIVLSGFTSAVYWLVFAGLIIGVAINETGLGKRFADQIVIHLEGSYLKIIAGVVLIGVLFSFLMPSAMGRVILLIPIALGIAEHFGFSAGSNGRTAIILAAIFGTFIPAFSILPANVANMILAGLAENQFNLSFLYGEYLLLHFPVLGMLKAVAIILLLIWLYPDTPSKKQYRELSVSRKISKDESILLVLVVLLLVLWGSDFIHHISPAWIALGGAIFLLLPGINIVNPKAFHEKINFSSLLFVAGILGFGGVISSSGIGNIMAHRFLSVLAMEQGENFVNFMLLDFMAVITGFMTTLPGVPAVLTPLSAQLSQATGLPLESVMMTQVIGFSTVMFPYQAPPILVGLQMAGENISSAIKFCFWLTLVSLFVLMPCNFFWWQLMDMF